MRGFSGGFSESQRFCLNRDYGGGQVVPNDNIENRARRKQIAPLRSQIAAWRSEISSLRR